MSQSFCLPNLFTTTKTKRKQVWKVWVHDDYVMYQNYLIGGKEKEPTRRLCKETNVGKANYRSAHQQAVTEAKQRWVKMLDKGYKPDPKDEKGQNMFRQAMHEKQQQGNTNRDVLVNPPTVVTLQTSIIPSVIKPMLAFDYTKKKKYVKWEDGVYVQPKLDGVRCVARLIGGRVSLTTRTGKQFKFLNHIRNGVGKLLQRFPLLVLDGEFYVSHDALEEDTNESRFRFISSACRPVLNKPNPDEKKIEYHIFDIVDTEYAQKERFDALDELFRQEVPKCLKQVPFFTIKNEEQLVKYQTQFLEDGYEGVMLRFPTGKYECRRSTNLIKYKKFPDAEFLIVGAKSAEGSEEGCVVWKCQTPQGQTFWCRPLGTHEHRRELYQNQTDYLNKYLTVIYQDLSPEGIPRFCRGKEIRYDL